MLSTKAALTALALGGTAFAAQDARTYGIGYFWSSPLVEARMDPIISPGQISSHVHSVVGGDAFSITMGADTAANASCTQSRVDGDKSNYWFPALYHHDAAGTFTKVTLDYVKAYYFFEPTDDTIVPFPPGFRMISGNPFQRSATHLPYSDNLDPNAGPVQPISFTCPQSGTSNAWNSTQSTSTGQGPSLPDQNCDGYASPLRYNVHFPSCILPDAPYSDYANNTAWATSAGASAAGRTNCPQGYTHVPHLFVEAYWNTMDFADWPTGTGSQPFVLAQGDPTGYGLHADFVSGWDEGVLSGLISTCNAGAHGDGLDSCPGVSSYTGSPTNCTVESANPTEVVTGTLKALPGCNPIQPGPEMAVLCDCSGGSPVCDGSSTTTGGGSGGNGTAASNTTSSAAAGASATGASGSGSGYGSGSGSGSGSSSISASATASATSSAAAAASSAAAGSGSDGGNPSKTSSGSSSSDDGSGDEGDDGDDSDDDTCEPDESAASGNASAGESKRDTFDLEAVRDEGLVRRHARHLMMHKGRRGLEGHGY